MQTKLLFFVFIGISIMWYNKENEIYGRKDKRGRWIYLNIWVKKRARKSPH